MKILVILGHPDPGSLNHAIAHAVRDDLQRVGHEVMFHDLYDEGFPPLLPSEEIPESGNVDHTVEAHCDALALADGHRHRPFLTGGGSHRPSSRAGSTGSFRPGVAYRFDEGDGGEGIPVGLLNASAAVVINTSNTPAEREQAAFGDPLEAIWRHCIFDLCGVTNFYRRMFAVVVTSTADQRLVWIEEAKRVCRTAFPAPTEG